jgi:hypothetical protein
MRKKKKKENRKECKKNERYLDFDFSVHLAKIVHNTIKVQLSGTENDVFTRFFNLEEKRACSKKGERERETNNKPW